MNKFKYAFNHGKVIAFILIIAISFVTSFVFETISQLNSAKNGIEILLVDAYLSVGGADELAKEVKSATSVKYVGAATINEKDTREYIKTVKDYSFSDYLTDTTLAKNAELIIVSKGLLPEIYEMKNIVSLALDIDADEECYHNGVLYAFPLKNTFVTEYESTVISLQEDTFAILLDGDHTEDVRKYLLNLNSEEK